MLKQKKYNLYAIAVVFVLVGVAYILEKFWTLPVSNLNYPYGFNPSVYIYSILFGTVACLVLLLFFDKKISIPWIKYIAWWIIPFFWWVVPLFADDLIFDVYSVANIFMGALFIITLIYALIMHHRLKNEHVKR